MSHTSRITDAITRIGTEIKAVRGVANSKYAKPSGGIPFSDLATQPVARTSSPGQLYGTDWDSGSQITLTYDNEPYGETIAERYTDGRLRVGDAVEEQDAVAKGQLDAIATAALRWEQEILVQSGVRVGGYGAAPLGIHIPYDIVLKGVRYQFETVTTGGTTTGSLMLNQTLVLNGMSIPANSLVQTNTLAVSVSAGSRLSFSVSSIGSGTVGKGLYMSLWGEYA